LREKITKFEEQCSVATPGAWYHRRQRSGYKRKQQPN